MGAGHTYGAAHDAEPYVAAVALGIPIPVFQAFMIVAFLIFHTVFS